jgi:hypothetical protein
MVAKAEVYMCQYCQSIYLEEQDAIDCEAMHTLPEQFVVIDACNWSEIDDNKRFPNKIIIEDKDYSGVAAEYYLFQTGSIEDFYEREPWNKLGEYGTDRVNHKLGVPKKKI